MIELQLSRKNECEGLLSDCRVGVKKSEKTIQRECIGSMHSNLLSEPWYESDDHVARQAVSDSWTAGCTLASGTFLA